MLITVPISIHPEPYRKWQHLFRFHSWMPFYADIEAIKADPTAIRPGVSIMTQNTLSTLISTIGYEYSAEKRHVLHSRITWKGWYPVFESQLDYGTLPDISKSVEQVSDPSVYSARNKFFKYRLSSSPVLFRQILRVSASLSFS